MALLLGGPKGQSEAEEDTFGSSLGVKLLLVSSETLPQTPCQGQGRSSKLVFKLILLALGAIKVSLKGLKVFPALV